MERTQIYLTKREKAALTCASKKTGRTRSQLIRDAIDARFLTSEADGLVSALRATAGIWSERAESGETYVKRIRMGRLERLYAPDEH